MSIALDGTAARQTSTRMKVRTGRGPKRALSRRDKVTEDNPYSLVMCISLLIVFGLIVEFGPTFYPHLVIY